MSTIQNFFDAIGLDPLILIGGAMLAIALLSAILVLISARRDSLRDLRESSQPEPPKKPLQPIGYKYAEIGRGGLFQGLARGKPYWIDSTVDSSAMGFHSYKSPELLRANTREEAYHNRGALMLEVLHYGEITEYEDGFVSTGQRVLQVAQSDGYCFGFPSERNYCTRQSEFVYIMGRKKSLRLCRPHYAGFKRTLNLVPGRKLINIHRWIEALAASEDGKRVRVYTGSEPMELTQ